LSSGPRAHARIEETERYGIQSYEWFTYFYGEMKRISDDRGDAIAVPETFTRYILDE